MDAHIKNVIQRHFLQREIKSAKVHVHDRAYDQFHLDEHKYEYLENVLKTENDNYTQTLPGEHIYQ